MAEIERPLPRLPGVVEAGPRRAAVVGPEDAPFLSFDDGPDPLRHRWRHGDTDAALRAAGEARVVGQLDPGVAAV